MAKRLLIAGYGFLGVAVRDVFKSAGWSVRCLNRSGSGGAEKCDLTSEGEVALINGDFDLVIHCAASGGGSVDDYRDIYLHGCEHLVKRFTGTPMIFTSSTSVYPQADHSVVDEQSPADPTSPRAQILREAEEVVIAAAGNVARLTGLYGEGRCHVLKNYLAGTAVLDGEGERVMNFVHRSDVAVALRVIADAGVSGEIFNVNGGHATQREVYQSLADHYRGSLPPSADPDLPRKRGNTSKRVSTEKLSGLGWEARYADFLSLSQAC